MEKRTFKISWEVLKRFDEAGILRHVVLIGSWSVYFYKYYFNSESYKSYIRTMDIDFVLPLPMKFKKEINVLKIVEDLGFIEVFMGRKVM